MGDTRGDEEDVARPEGVALRSVAELASSREHDVHLVAGVRRLGVVHTPRGIQLDAQGAVAEELGEALAFGPGQPPRAGNGQTVLRASWLSLSSLEAGGYRLSVIGGGASARGSVTPPRRAAPRLSGTDPKQQPAG